MNDTKIIAAIRDRDPAAIDEVMERYVKLLWSVVAPILRQASIQDVEECVADVFIYLWEHPEKYDPARGSLKTWLSIVARSQAIDRGRKITRRSTVPLEEVTELVGPDVVEDFLVQEETHAVENAVEALSEPEREIFVRRYYLDQKPSQIAGLLDMPVKTVENRLYRAKQKLRKKLHGERRSV